MKRRFALLATVAIVVLLTVLIVAFSERSLGPGVVAHGVSPDGVEMFVVQRSNWGGWANLRNFFDDPWFTTRFICRTADGTWKSYYYWHEDTSWLGRDRLVLDTNASKAVVYRGNVAVMRFRWDTGEFQITRPYADGVPALLGR